MIRTYSSMVTFVAIFICLFSTMTFASYKDGAIAYKLGDFEKAYEHWLPLAKEDHAKAQFKLGGMFAKGKGVKKDVPIAFKWYSEAAGNGHKRAAYNMAYMLFNGVGVARDEKAAFIIYNRLATKGEMLEAQHAMAFAYAEGRGITQSFKNARKWYEKAALENYLLSQLSLAELLLGSSDLDNRNMAVFWVEVACIRGSTRALKRLKYFSKNGVDKTSLQLHYENALDWLKDSHPNSVPRYEKCPLETQISATN